MRTCWKQTGDQYSCSFSEAISSLRITALVRVKHSKTSLPSKFEGVKPFLYLMTQKKARNTPTSIYSRNGVAIVQFNQLLQSAIDDPRKFFQTPSKIFHFLRRRQSYNRCLQFTVAFSFRPYSIHGIRELA